MYGEKRLRRANDELALFLYRNCLETLPPYLAINSQSKSETIWFTLSLYDIKRYYSFEGRPHSLWSCFQVERYLKNIEKS